MKKNVFLIMIAAVLLCCAFITRYSQDWQVQKNFAIHFKGKYADGAFTQMDGKIQFDASEPTRGSFNISIPVNSINTGNGLKNRHAKSARWFDAAKYPLIHFISTAITKNSTGYEVRGLLDMHGVQQPVVIPFVFEQNGDNGLFKGHFRVDRTLFGLGDKKEDDRDFTEIEIVVPVVAKS